MAVQTLSSRILASMKTLNVPNLEGKVAIVTGGNRGIGFQLAQQLAKYGAKVYLAARSEAAAKEAIEQIEHETPELQRLGDKNRIEFLHLDLSTLKGSKAAAETFLKLEKRLDVLINNAALLPCRYATTSDGIESTMAVNHFGTFVFTQTLFDLLVSTAKESDVRVVNMSSFLHAQAPAGGQFSTLDEINSPLTSAASAPDGLISNHLRYSRSKLANMLYTIQLQKEFKAVGSNALAISVNPGGVATDGALATSSMYPFLSALVRFVFSTFWKSPLEGATTALYAATSAEVRANAGLFGGAYVVPYGQIGKATKDGQDGDLAKTLWDVTGSIANATLAMTE
ncbi:hypothetical protein PTI98_010151 [Pleurotus ostreatus]|uniref:Uncharacterized protein n=1 Tax=Pleurotus cornucopiae TaxID=5321 RepID=A0ACB7J297_PLECO|nr:hypothetical protein CCMSSC00406_0002152 [Pleurotus cornucopiae]KAJ8692882.1 hypothetical protein PTI98_010151 [Pleurotus ostreatus]